VKIIKTAYSPLIIVLAVIAAILITVYVATQKYNTEKNAEINATASAFLAGKILNCTNGSSEEDISIARGWQYRDSDGNIRFKKESTIFLVTQCKETK
jgi:hypothetical protein